MRGLIGKTTLGALTTTSLRQTEHDDIDSERSLVSSIFAFFCATSENCSRNVVWKSTIPPYGGGCSVGSHPRVYRLKMELTVSFDDYGERARRCGYKAG
jgi:hypothetical protein